MKRIWMLLLIAALAVSFCGCVFQKEPTEPDYDQFTNAPATEAVTKVEELSLVVDENTISQLDNYPNLKTVDLSGSTCYGAIMDYIKAHPQVDVTYTVAVGGNPIHCGTTGLTLEPGTFDFITLINNLKYLPQVTTVSLPKTDLPIDRIEALIAAYPKVDISYSFLLDGQELGAETTELNLSGHDTANLEQVLTVLPLMKNLTTVELMKEDGTTAFTPEQVKQMKQANPNALYRYSFELFGKTVSTSDEKLDFTDQKIGNEGEAALRAALDIMPSNAYIKVENCGFDNEILGGIQQDYPDATIVWRVYYGNQNGLTDAVTIRHVYNLKDSNCDNLKYFTKVKYMDIGHNDTLTHVNFCAYMPDLEILIASGSLVSDLSALSGCKNLTWLELAFCTKVTDITPLAQCTGLKYLNLGYCNVTDTTPVHGLALERFHYIANESPKEMRQEFIDSHPDTICVFGGTTQPYGYGWRYDDNGYTFFSYYKKIREIFNYDKADAIIKAQQEAEKGKK